MRGLLFVCIALIAVVPAFCQSPPSFGSYSMQIAGIENGESVKGMEYYDQPNNRYHEQDLNSNLNAIFFINEQTEVYYNNVVCNTSCYQGDVCNSPGTKCGFVSNGVFAYLVDSSLTGKCANGDNEWSYAIPNAGVSMIYCISASNVPSSLSLVGSDYTYISITISNWNPTTPDPKYFITPSNCPCVNSAAAVPKLVNNPRKTGKSKFTLFSSFFW